MGLQIPKGLKRLQILAGTEAEGQGLVEYALIILFIAIACLVALGTMADAIMALWNQVTGVLIPAM